jgi:hypothetical protein
LAEEKALRSSGDVVRAQALREQAITLMNEAVGVSAAADKPREYAFRLFADGALVAETPPLSSTPRKEPFEFDTCVLNQNFSLATRTLTVEVVSGDVVVGSTGAVQLENGAVSSRYGVYSDGKSVGTLSIRLLHEAAHHRRAELDDSPTLRMDAGEEARLGDLPHLSPRPAVVSYSEPPRDAPLLPQYGSSLRERFGVPHFASVFGSPSPLVPQLRKPFQL